MKMGEQGGRAGLPQDLISFSSPLQPSKPPGPSLSADLDSITWQNNNTMAPQMKAVQQLFRGQVVA